MLITDSNGTEILTVVELKDTIRDILENNSEDTITQEQVNKFFNVYFHLDEICDNKSPEFNEFFYEMSCVLNEKFPNLLKNLSSGDVSDSIIQNYLKEGIQ